jgi:hypothetical protein
LKSGSPLIFLFPHYLFQAQHAATVGLAVCADEPPARRRAIVAPVPTLVNLWMPVFMRSYFRPEWNSRMPFWRMSIAIGKRVGSVKRQIGKRILRGIRRADRDRVE